MIEFAHPSIEAQLAEHEIDAATLERVITEAESTGSKLYLPDKNVFLAKAEREANVVYVKYSFEQGGKPRVLLVYSTKARFAK